eukprot:tig00001029_g6423.t1
MGVFRQAVSIALRPAKAGARAGVLLAATKKCFAAVSRLADERRLSPEAAPFYPLHLRRLFDAAPALLDAAPRPPMPSYTAREAFPSLYPVPEPLLAPAAELEKWLPQRLSPLAAEAGPIAYTERMHAVLWVEEVQMLHDIKAYDLFHAPLPPARGDARLPAAPAHGDLLRVRVAGEEAVEYHFYVQAVLAPSDIEAEA